MVGVCFSQVKGYLPLTTVYVGKITRKYKALLKSQKQTCSQVLY